MSVRGFSIKRRMHRDLVQPGEQELFERLASFATRVLRTGPDYLLVFDLSDREDAGVTKRDSIARGLIETFNSGLTLYKQLSELAGKDGQESILREVHLFIERQRTKDAENKITSPAPLHLLIWLSDGERSFLGRMCLSVELNSSRC